MPWNANIFPFSLDPTTMAMINNIEGGVYGEVVMVQKLQVSYPSSIFGGNQQEEDNPSFRFGGTQQYKNNPTSVFGGTQPDEDNPSSIFGGISSIFGGIEHNYKGNPASIFGGTQRLDEDNPSICAAASSIFGGAQQDGGNSSSIFGGTLQEDEGINTSSLSPSINIMGYYDRYRYNNSNNPGTNNEHNNPLLFSTPPGLPPLSPSPSRLEANNDQTLFNNFYFTPPTEDQTSANTNTNTANSSVELAIPIENEGAPKDQFMDDDDNNNNINDLYVPPYNTEKQGNPRVESHHSRAASLDSINKVHSLILHKCYHDLEESSKSSTRSTRRHTHSHSMDCGNSDQMKTILANEKLMEVALVDPKRAKRILSNRQSAARSKDRKARYIYDLEMRVQALQFEATSLLAHVNVMQRDNTQLSHENNGLKLQLQAMEQEARLRDALNDALKEEIQKLKLGGGDWHAHSEVYTSFLTSSTHTSFHTT